CSSWADVISLAERFRPTVEGDDPRGCYANALRCAVELSILDAFGQLFREPVGNVASHFTPAKPILPHSNSVPYTVVFDSAARGPVRRFSRLQSESRCGRRRRCAAAGDHPPLDRPADGPPHRRERSLAFGRATNQARAAASV